MRQAEREAEGDVMGRGGHLARASSEVDSAVTRA